MATLLCIAACPDDPAVDTDDVSATTGALGSTSAGTTPTSGGPGATPTTDDPTTGDKPTGSSITATDTGTDPSGDPSTDPSGDPSTDPSGPGTDTDSTGGETSAGETDTGETSDTSTGADPVCGDGQVDPGEGCDAGADNGPGKACKADCSVNVCGDGDKGPGEACDDGNKVDDDGCSDCILPACGNNKVDPGEQCDDGQDGDNTDDCTDACLSPACGDGFVQTGETCDLGAGNSDAGECSSGCKLAKCGDGLVWAGEEACDDGNQIDDDACSNLCEIPVDKSCGGSFEAGEFCFAGSGTSFLVDDGRFVLVGKFNGDSHLDIIASEYAMMRVQVRLGDGQGGFDMGTGFAVPDGAPTRMATADIDADGDLDLLVVTAAGVTVMTNTGGGKFVNQGVALATTGAPSSIVAGDLDGDGDPDFATGDGDGNRLTIRWGAAGATFVANPTQLRAGTRVSELQAVDMNADGKLDLVALNSLSGTVGVHVNLGARKFARQRTYRVPIGAVAMRVGKLDGDAYNDLVVADAATKSLYVRKGNASAGFANAPYHVRIGAVPTAVTLADFDADGALDLIAPVQENNLGSVLAARGDGAGGFKGAVRFPVKQYPNHVVAADIDEDGRVDLVSVHANFGDAVQVSPADASFKSPVCQGICQAGICGDGLVAPTEACDDGNAVDNDACRNDCMFPPLTGCGNLIVEPGELCYAAAEYPHKNQWSQYPYSYAADGDFNGDGFVDLVVGLSDKVEGHVDSDGYREWGEIWLGTGEGGYELVQSARLTGSFIRCGDDPRHAWARDMNKDGKLDAIIGCSGQGLENGGMVVRLGMGDGTFGPLLDSNVAKKARGLGIGDVDGDGILDLLQSGGENPGVDVIVRWGLGGGEYEGIIKQYTWQVGGGGNDPYVGDFTGDGIPDILMAGGNVAVAPGKGGKNFGNFQDAILVSQGEAPHRTALADFNGDGIIDIGGASSNGATALVMIGDGFGYFAKLGASVATGVGGTNGLAIVSVADVDGNGAPDLTVASDKATFAILRGDGGTSLQAPKTFGVGSAIQGMRVQEVSVDGFGDVFVGIVNKTLLMRSNP